MKNTTELIIILDRSGSMESIRKDMIGGFNAFLREQKKNPTDCKVSFYQFDAQYGDILETCYERRNLPDVPDLTTETFVPRGGTPLYDAVAQVIRKVTERIKDSENNERPERVLVVIITDGEENSSREWKGSQVKQMIENQQEKCGWEFVYLGANQDAWANSEALGVKASSTLGYVATAAGTGDMWKSLSDKTMKYRVAACVAKGIDFDEDDRKAQKSHGYKS